MWRSCCFPIACEQGIELAGALERIQIVAAADMRLADKNLRYGHLSIGSLDHGLALLPVSADIDLIIGCALLFQQGLGGSAIGAIAGGVDINRGHRFLGVCCRSGPV